MKIFYRDLFEKNLNQERLPEAYNFISLLPGNTDFYEAFNAQEGNNEGDPNGQPFQEPKLEKLLKEAVDGLNDEPVKTQILARDVFGISEAQLAALPSANREGVIKLQGELAQAQIWGDQNLNITPEFKNVAVDLVKEARNSEAQVSINTLQAIQRLPGNKDRDKLIEVALVETYQKRKLSDINYPNVAPQLVGVILNWSISLQNKGIVALQDEWSSLKGNQAIQQLSPDEQKGFYKHLALLTLAHKDVFSKLNGSKRPTDTQWGSYGEAYLKIYFGEETADAILEPAGFVEAVKKYREDQLKQ